MQRLSDSLMPLPQKVHLNRKILYVPIGQLSPTKLKKLRVVHVLDSYARRAEAKEYIW